MIDNNEQTINPILGLVSKSLRKSKGYTLKEATGNSFSSTYLSNFENGKTDLSAHLFLELLDNINVSTAEFQNYYEETRHSYDNHLFFDEDILIAYTTKNIKKLENILTILDSKHNKKKTCKKYELERIRLKSLVFLLDSNRPLPKNDIFFLKSYLMQLKEWGNYDIVLFGQCFPNLDLGTISILSEKMTNPCQKVTSLKCNHKVLIDTILKLMNHFIENNQFNKANQLIDYLKMVKINENYMFETLIFIYQISILKHRLGEEGALNTIEKCKEILEFCGCSESAKKITKEILYIKNEKNKTI